MKFFNKNNNKGIFARLLVKKEDIISSGKVAKDIDLHKSADEMPTEHVQIKVEDLPTPVSIPIVPEPEVRVPVYVADEGTPVIKTEPSKENKIFEPIPTIEPKKISVKVFEEEAVALPQSSAVVQDISNAVETPPSSDYLYLKSGTVLKSPEDLAEVLKDINQEVWNEHVGAGRNDFADWVLRAFDDKQLADHIREYKTPDVLRTYLRHNL